MIKRYNMCDNIIRIIFKRRHYKTEPYYRGKRRGKAFFDSIISNQIIINFIITIILLRISWTDLRERKIGKTETACLVFLGISGRFTFMEALVGGVICAAIPELVNLCVSNLCGLGGGDIRLMFAAGWLLGIDGGLFALLLAGIAALIVSGLYGIQKPDNILEWEIPFGPFLSLGIAVMLWSL